MQKPKLAMRSAPKGADDFIRRLSNFSEGAAAVDLSDKQQEPIAEPLSAPPAAAEPLAAPVQEVRSLAAEPPADVVAPLAKVEESEQVRGDEPRKSSFQSFVSEKRRVRPRGVVQRSDGSELRRFTVYLDINEAKRLTDLAAEHNLPVTEVAAFLLREQLAAL